MKSTCSCKESKGWWGSGTLSVDWEDTRTGRWLVARCETWSWNHLMKCSTYSLIPYFVMNVSHVNISQWGFSRLNLPSKVKATVNPNQYLVKMGRDLNHSWMSPPAILLPLKSFHIQFNLISKEININQSNHRRTCRQYVGELFSVWILPLK